MKMGVSIVPGSHAILASTRWMLLSAVLLFLLLLAAAPGATADTSGPLVVVAHLDGEVDPVTASYVHRVVASAQERQAALLVLTIDTPGGLDSSMRGMVQDLLSSTVPSVAYVAPSGARAASAGVFIAEAANVLAMAPGTNIGAAHPIQGDGSDIGGDLRDKITNDAAAYIASIAKQRGRNDTWVQDAVRQSSSLDAQAAVDQGVADLIEPDLDTLLRDLDGRGIAGSTTIHTAGATLEVLDMQPVELVAHRLFDPNIAYLLLTVGFLAILVELIHPGALLPGITGAICLILAVVSSTALPMNWGGALLILVAGGLVVIDLKAATHGGLTIGALIAFVLGSLLLYSPAGPRSPTLPDVSVAPAFFVSVTALGALLSVLLARTAIRIRRRRPITGIQQLIGARGVTRSTLDPLGSVRVGGQVWSARLRGGRLEADTPIRVLARKGLTLEVERLEAASSSDGKEATL